MRFHIRESLTWEGFDSCFLCSSSRAGVTVHTMMPQYPRYHTCIPGLTIWMLAASTFLFMVTGGHQGTLEQYSLSLFIREDASSGTLVGEVKGNKFNPPYARWISQATDSRTLSCFHVDLLTGRIMTKGKLDREEQDRHTIIISTSFFSPKLVIIDVRVLDVNDFTPVFLNSFLKASISESAPKDHKIPLGSVKDEDLGENTTQTIEIVSGNDDNDFVLEIKNSSSVDKIVDLVVNYQLDYERTSVYNFVIRATDGGGRFSEMEVIINILDQNDHEPIFNMSKYSAKVDENIAVGALILQVHATDMDSGENSRLTYSIDPRSDPEEVFTISATTGWISVRKPLDYESRGRFSLTLQARDNGISQHMGTAALDIIVDNVSEQSADIVLQFQPLFSHGRVPEDTSVGTLVAVISIGDQDNYISSSVGFFLYRSDGYFTLKTDDFLGLYVSSELDREMISDLEMVLQVVDNGVPPVRANKVFKVIIDDVNDNSPVFEKPEYVVDVEELAGIGTEVVRVTAVDSDVGDNAQITYHLDDNSQNMGWFTVNSNTGVVTTKATLDCNLNPQHSLVVVATDGGNPPRMGSTQVMVNVRNGNNKVPEFETSFYSIRISENRRVGDCILRVLATDPECGTNSPVTYKMLQMQASVKEFRVDAGSGAVCVEAELDYERIRSYQFQVEATDIDGLSTQAVVQIEVTDVNDNHPRFEPREYSINVLSGVEPDQLVTVQSRDRDSGIFGTVTYSITEGNEQGYFDMNTITGALSLTKPLPESEDLFILRVVAMDGGGLTSPDPGLVTVSVISGRVHPPIFTPTVFNFTVSENAQVGHVVGYVQASLDDTGVNMGIVYSSLFQTADWFNIDSQTGCVYTKSSLDRELQPFVVLSIQAHAGFPPVYTVAQVNVTILDVNDNRPYFLSTTMLELDIWEDEVTGIALYIARANDVDMGNNGTVVYQLHDELSSTFAINDYSGEISLVRELDYELVQEYLLVVVAEDMGTPVRLSSNMTLTVKVKDVNDNPPLFERDVYHFYIPENVEAGHSVGRVVAIDLDSGHNKRLSFSLRTNSYDSVFGLSSMDGIMWTQNILDREQQEIYEMTVVAVDHGSFIQLSATALVRVIVTDVNDNVPSFSRDVYTFFIMENMGYGSLVGHVTAEDLDVGDNGNVYYFFSGPQTNFSINSRTGEIRTQISLDRELTAEHVITVYASDKGENPKTAATKVVVTVMDENDNDPMFQRQGPLSVRVSENRPKGTEVITLAAVDRDEEVNALITYFFDKEQSESAALANFEMHPRSGRVTTKEVLDYETQSEYHLTVVAKDGGHMSRQTSLSLSISVLDANDQAHLHHSRYISLDLVENTSIGTRVGQVKESMEETEVSYYLVGGNVFSSFSVDHKSGVITTIGGIDYEKASSHSLSIQAVGISSDLTGNINISVTINVLDVNDNAPIFEQDPVMIHALPENTPEQQVIYKFTATDRDSGVNGTVHYSIQACPGEECYASYFHIDRDTGELYISRLIDYEMVDQITLIVKAEDACPYPDHIQNSLVTTIIYVADVNDSPPEFKSTNHLMVSEDEVIGSVILAVVALDADSNIEGSGNSVIRYHIVSGSEDGKFLLGSDTGYLSIHGNLDFERQAHYTLNISAEDSGIPKMVNYQYIHITVTDVNDNTPEFDQAVYHASISEDIETQVSVIKVMASDADSNENGHLTYFIPAGIAEDKFTVDPQTGVVTTLVRLDREVKDLYTLTVFVKDGAYPVHYSSCNLVITVNDVNDNPPVFRNQQYIVQIPENRLDKSVLTLVAADRDLGENARLTYTITDGNDGKFKINPQTGVLAVEPLDREVTSAYNLTVTARDHGNNPRTATTYVSVIVQDENDNSPVFEELVYTASAPENTKQGTVMLIVTARDLDLHQNGHVVYSLDDETDCPFLINSSTGEIYSSGIFDREKVPTYSFLILASDNGVFGPRNSTAVVIITITDINDNPPTFSMVPYTASVDLFTPARTYILTVAASDPDVGNNGIVKYSLKADAGSRDFLEELHIDDISGEVYTKTAMFRASGHYSLLVVATDSGAGTQLSSTGVIEITVGSGDSIQFQFSTPEYRVEIPEHLTRGSYVISVDASFGPAYPQSQSTTYSFASGNEKKAYRIDARSGQITVTKPALLDYETSHQTSLTVRAINGNHHSYTKVLVNLTDINDNAPKFSQTKYLAAVLENNHSESYVAQVIARDADSGLNGEINYSIIGGNEDMVFKISKPQTGIVVTNSEAAPLDREAQPSGYRLTIEARDSGNPSKFSTCILVVSVIDENDTPPFFPRIGPKNVSENCGVGCLVTIVTANDVDLNPVLSYGFTTDGNPDNTFSLDQVTGCLTLAKRLDYEKKSHYSVGIQVTDGKPDHMKSTWLDVYVIDENDNPPIFLQPSYQVALQEQTGPHHSVLTLVATDADTGQNAQVTYSLAHDSFYVNADTGTIYTSKMVSFTLGESIIQLLAVARDNGTEVQTSTAVVHVHITAVNKHVPRFLEPLKYVAHVSESAQRGHPVLQVSAMDTDSSHHVNNINYALIGPGSDLFYIHPHTGDIVCHGGLDFEQEKQYNLTALATDRGVPAKSTSIPVVIILDDINDNPPVFLEDKYSITLDENSEPLQEFLTVSTSDADTGVHGEVRYFITSGNSEGIFLNPDSNGRLMVADGKSLDHELHPFHHLIVKVVDCVYCPLASAHLSSFVVVDIQVRDINEFRPRFPVKHYTEEVVENTKMGVAVFRVHANDDDVGEMGVVSYSLMNELDYQMFAVDAVTGEVTTSWMFDYETDRATHLYNLVVVAADAGHNYDMTDVTIRVIDEDEFDPVMTEDEYIFDIPGSAKVGDVVGVVSAHDDDGGEAGRIVYAFLEATDYFLIDPITGNITVATTLHENPAVLGYDNSKRRKRTLTTERVDLTILVSSGHPGSRQGTAACVININRTCPECAAPFDDIHITTDVDGGILAGIIIACVIVIIMTIVGILCLVYQHKKSGKAMTSYLSDTAINLEPPTQLAHNRTVYGDVIRGNFSLSGYHINTDVLDQSPRSTSSGWGSGEIDKSMEYEINRINSVSFLPHTQTFCQKAVPASGIQQDGYDTQAELAAQTCHKYLTRLAIDSSGKTKAIFNYNNYANDSNKNSKDLDLSESMHLFSEDRIEAVIDTDMQKTVGLVNDSEVATLKIQPRGMCISQPDTYSCGHLFTNEETSEESYDWGSFVNWSPQYQPLAEVFLQIAELQDESLMAKQQTIKNVSQNQFCLLPEQSVVHEVPHRTSSLTIPHTNPVSINTNVDILQYGYHVSASPSGSTTHLSQLQLLHNPQLQRPQHLIYSNCNFLPYHMQQQMSEEYRVLLSHPPESPQMSSSECPYNIVRCHSHSPYLNHSPCHNVCTSQQHHSSNTCICLHQHPPPVQLPPPSIPQKQQHTLSSSSSYRPQESSTQTINLHNPAQCLPCSSYNFEYNLTSTITTPSHTISQSSQATPSLPPMVSCNQHSSKTRQPSIQNSSNTQSLSSCPGREFHV